MFLMSCLKLIGYTKDDNVDKAMTIGVSVKRKDIKTNNMIAEVISHLFC